MSERCCANCVFMIARQRTTDPREQYHYCTYAIEKPPLAKWMLGYHWEVHTHILFDASMPSAARVVLDKDIPNNCEAFKPKDKTDD